MKKNLFIIILLTVAFSLTACDPATKGLVFTKHFNEQSRAYYSVSGGGKTDYTIVKIPDTYDGAYVEVIAEKAFLDCKNLTEINIPPHVSFISFQAFKNCSALTSLLLPTSLMSIAPDAFSGCRSLKGITIPDNVVYIDIQAFQNCTSLKNVLLPVFISGVKDRDFLEKIEDRVFSGCSALTYIPLPDGIKSIGLSSFENCFALKDVEFPDNLVSIGNRAFYNCSALEKVVLPKNLKSVGYNAFYGCSAVSEVVINAPDQQTEDSQTEDEDLEYIEDFICDDAFFGCKIKKLTIYRSEVINFAAFDFSGDLTDLEIKVSPLVYQDYLSDSDWGTLANYITTIE